MTIEGEEQETSTSEETTAAAETTSDRPSETEGRKLEFEEPNFSELTDFVEKDGEATVAAAGEETVEPGEEKPSTEEAAQPAEKKEGESEEEVKEPVEKVEGAEKKEAPKEEVQPKKEEEEEPPKAAQPEVKMPTEEELTGMYKDHREKTLPKLQEIYALSEEDAAALDENPSKVLPKLAAQLHYDVMMSTYNAVIAAIPSVTNRLIDVSKKATTAEEEFYKEWPDLNKPELKPIVATAISSYRGSNPRAELKDVIKKAGVMAMINAGLDPTKKAGEVTTTPKKPTPPAKPAGARQTTQVTPPKPKEDGETNIFATMAEAFQKEYG